MNIFERGKKGDSIHTIKDAGWMVFVWSLRGFHIEGDAVRNLCLEVCVLMCVWIGQSAFMSFLELLYGVFEDQ